MVPLQLIVLEYGLQLLNKSFLIIIKLLLLHPESALDILEQVFSSLYLPLALLLPLSDGVPYQRLLLIKLPFH